MGIGGGCSLRLSEIMLPLTEINFTLISFYVECHSCIAIFRLCLFVNPKKNTNIDSDVDPIFKCFVVSWILVRVTEKLQNSSKRQLPINSGILTIDIYSNLDLTLKVNRIFSIVGIFLFLFYNG